MSSSYFEYSFTGAEHLQEALRLLKDLPTEKRLVKKAISKSLEPILDAAVDLSPVDKGNLRDSWFISPRLSKTQKNDISDDAVGVYVGSDDQSAHLVEFGTRAHTVTVQKKKTLFGFGRVLGTEADIPEIAPQPVMRPAFEGFKTVAFNRLGDEIWKNLAALADRLNRQAGKGKLSASGKRTLGIK